MEKIFDKIIAFCQITITHKKVLIVSKFGTFSRSKNINFRSLSYFWPKLLNPYIYVQKTNRLLRVFVRLFVCLSVHHRLLSAVTCHVESRS
jgi:hypothetical protein